MNHNYNIKKVVDTLCTESSYKGVVHFDKHQNPMPSVLALKEIIELIRAVIFPGYFKEPDITTENLSYYTGAKIDKIAYKLKEQVTRGFCFECNTPDNKRCNDCDKKADRVIKEFLEFLPELREMMSKDVKAGYEGDPAAKSRGELIFSYPSIQTMLNYRVAHKLYDLEVPLIPRIITEIAHSEFGVDIHPGAQIGEYFFMDHCTGIVIGGTAIIGDNVKLYHGVTLGAKSFPKDENGVIIKGIPRHPIVEDGVVIYSGSTILGRVTIGRDSIIGGNVWLMKSVSPNSRILKN